MFQRLPREHAVMADAGLHVVHLAIGAHAGAEVLRGQRLADRADVVLLALDRHQAHSLDRGGVHRPAAMHQLALRQQMLLEHVAHGLDVEFRRQVHHREIFVVEGLDDLGLLLLALGEVIGEIDVLLDVAFEIHRDESGELHEAGIDLPERALALKRHVVDQVLLEPFDRLALGEFVDLGRLDAGVDRAGHQASASPGRAG